MSIPRITTSAILGYIIQVSTLVILASIGWGVHKTTAEVMEKRLNEHQDTLIHHSNEIREADKTNAILLTKLQAIDAALQEIKQDIKKK